MAFMHILTLQCESVAMVDLQLLKIVNAILYWF